MKYAYAAVITKEGNGYRISVPDVLGCSTGGRTAEDATRQMQDALSACLCVLEDEHDPIPAPTAPEAVAAAHGGTCVLIDVDTDAYRAETSPDGEVNGKSGRNA